jgi:hypothetical protein
VKPNSVDWLPAGRDLKVASRRMSAFMDEARRSGGTWYHSKQPKTFRTSQEILALDREEQVEIVLAALAKWIGLKDRHVAKEYSLEWLFTQLARRRLLYSDNDLIALAEGIGRLHRGGRRSAAYGLIRLFEVNTRGKSLSEPVAERLRQLRATFIDSYASKELTRALAQLDAILGDSPKPDTPQLHRRTEAALEHLGELAPERRAAWAQLLAHCATATTSNPTAKWMAKARTLLDALTADAFRAPLAEWFRLADPEMEQAATERRQYWKTPTSADEQAHLNQDTLRGLAWTAGLLDDRASARALATLALAGYRRAPEVVALAPKVGNAAILALGDMPGREGLAQLAVLKFKLPNSGARRKAAEALEAVARRLEIAPEEVDELSVPDYGLTDVGRLSQTVETLTAEMTIHSDGSNTLAWRGPGGTEEKTTPAAMKQAGATAVRALRTTAKDVAAMLSAQRNRLDTLFLARKRWPWDTWRERYLDHPVVGILARRLIWQFHRGGHSESGLFHEGQFIDRAGVRIAALGPDTTVVLWHPIEHGADEVHTWRTLVEKLKIRQPFKQAHREVYRLTDAERRTRTYSNRFAAHIVRQHQFHALCIARHWRYTLRLMVNNTYAPPTRVLAEWNLRAEFWVEGVGQRYGRDTTEVGTYLHLTTDQVRFYPIEAPQRLTDARGGGYRLPEGTRARDDTPVPFETVPPLVFAEVMRDIDLFVGVASVGNDPTWSDGGPDGRYVDYWQNYAFGDLSASAQTRGALLERLIPRLKIAGRCSVRDRFLVVRGDLRTYKIHLGSGNVLMEPDDHYLCIIADARRKHPGADDVFLPFEGDDTLSLILSKAFLLANDAKITDPLILSQIRSRA